MMSQMSTSAGADAPSTGTRGRWVEDILGEGWQARSLLLWPDTSGQPVATLVGARTESPEERATGPAVLYLHGFTDYFFQTEHGQAWGEAGYAFYALDLRDYGRSIRKGRRPGWITDLSLYFEEITAALALMREAGHQQVVLLGHSTGGLIAALYADAHPDAVDAVVLNSPWFDLNKPWPVRRIFAPLAARLGRFAPHLPVGGLDEAYGRSLHVSTGGDFDYDLIWKPLAGFDVHAGWLAAIIAGHRRVARGLDIATPVLVCTSARSGHPARPSAADLAGADCVLDVAHMRTGAPKLGPDVQVVSIAGGRHDLALSVPPVRARYLRVVLDWLAVRTTPTVTPQANVAPGGRGP